MTRFGWRSDCGCYFVVTGVSNGQWTEYTINSRCENHPASAVTDAELLGVLVTNPDSESAIIATIDSELMKLPEIYQDVNVEGRAEKELKPGIVVYYEFSGKGKSRGVTVHISGALLTGVVKTLIKTKLRTTLGDAANGRVTL